MYEARHLNYLERCDKKECSMKFVPDLIEIVAQKTGYSKSAIKEIINEFRDSIIETLCNDEEVNIIHLGKFKVRNKKERMGEQPLTKEPVFVPARKTIIFSVCSTLKKKVK